MPDAILGLDIGSRSIKAVKVTGGMKGYALSACADVQLEAGAEIEDGLVRLSEKMSLSDATCIASFQPDHISFRNLTMPFKDRKKILQTIGFELEPMLPFSVDAIVTDCLLANHSEETRVLSASVPEDAFGEYLNSLAAQNLDPEIVDIADVSTAVQYAKQADEPLNALFLDIGSEITSLVLLNNGEVVLVRALHFGGFTVTEALAKEKDIPWEEAEALKCGGDARALSGVVEAAVASLSRQIQNTLHAFRFEVMTDAVVDTVFITGGGAQCPDLSRILEDHLKLPVETFDLAQLKGIQISEGSQDQWNPLLMNTALGLAVRDQRGRESFNLRVGKFAKKRKYDQVKKQLGRIGIYALVAFLALSGTFFADYYVLKKHHESYEKEITEIFQKTLPDVTRVVDPVRQLKAAISQTRGAMLLPQQSAGRGPTIEILRDVFLNIPKSVPLDVDRLTLDENRVRLRGSTDTFNSVDKIKSGLSKSSYFTGVSISSAQLDRSGENIRFELLMEQP